ncbi:MAG: TolC family protein [Pseudobdellovibrionaceae bacterium]
MQSQLLVFVFAIFISFVAPTQELTPEMVKEKVVKNNRHIEASVRIATAIQGRKGYLLRSYLPQVEAQAGVETFTKELKKEVNDPFYGVEASINLFRGFKDSEKDNQIKSEVDASLAEKDEIYLDELSKALESFWNVVYAKESLDVLKKYQELNKKNLTASKQRISAGVAPQTDFVEFEMNDKLLEQEKTRLDVLQKTSEQRLNILMHEGKDKTFLYPSEIPSAVMTQKVSGKVNPLGLSSVRKSEALAAKSSSESKVAGKWWMPELDLITGYKQLNRRESDQFLQRDRQDYYYGVRLKMNLFDAAQSITEKQTLAALAIAEEFKADQAKKELEIEYENQQKLFSTLERQVQDASSNQKMMKNYLESILREYSRGVKGSSEVLSASDRYYDYQKKYIELKRDYQLMKFQLTETMEEI